jgi:hypothetical protein
MQQWHVRHMVCSHGDTLLHVTHMQMLTHAKQQAVLTHASATIMLVHLLVYVRNS